MPHNDKISPLIVLADEITKGDIIKHWQGDIWQVISEPEYTYKGITFEVLWLDVDTLDNTQTVCFNPECRFELVNHLPSEVSGIPKHPIDQKESEFVASKIHRGQLIGILIGEIGFIFHIYEPDAVFDSSPKHYSDIPSALADGVKKAEQNFQWKLGFKAYEQGQLLPRAADANFVRGWKDAQESYGGETA